MDFNKTPIAPVTPIAPAKRAVPIDDREADEKIPPGIPVALGPGSGGGSVSDSSSLDNMGIDPGTLLAGKLHWEVPKSGK